jgi:hypothetical protein
MEFSDVVFPHSFTNMIDHVDGETNRGATSNKHKENAALLIV